MEEVWKDIKEYEGLYQVSNFGKVKSLNYRHTGKEKIMKASKDTQGYLFLNLYKNNKRNFYRVHRLVAQTFINNPNNYSDVNHIDENKENNNVKNLEWCSPSYNNNYGTRNKRAAKALMKPIYCLETNKTYNSIKECSKELNISQASIVHALKGRSKRAGRYIFRYANQVLYKGGK